MRALFSFILMMAIAVSGMAAGDPRSVVESFIADYFHWNNAAQASYDKSSGSAAMSEAEKAYQALLQRYCLPGFRGEPISFGSESSHVPGSEKVLSVHTAGAEAVVKTQMKDKHDFVADYEYHLVFLNGKWYLKNVYYVDGNEKYPSL
jgi:hypothetical protein